MSSNITGDAWDFLHLLQWKKKQFILLHVPSSLKTSKQNNNKHQKNTIQAYRIGSLQNYCKTRFQNIRDFIALSLSCTVIKGTLH